MEDVVKLIDVRAAKPNCLTVYKKSVPEISNRDTTESQPTEIAKLSFSFRF
jgi:hypothetical protein